MLGVLRHSIQEVHAAALLLGLLEFEVLLLYKVVLHHNEHFSNMLGFGHTCLRCRVGVIFTVFLELLQLVQTVKDFVFTVQRRFIFWVVHLAYDV